MNRTRLIAIIIIPLVFAFSFSLIDQSIALSQLTDSFLPIRYETSRSNVYNIVPLDVNDDGFEDVLMATESGVMLAFGSSAGLAAPTDIFPSLNNPIAWMGAGENLVNGNPGVVMASRETNGTSGLYFSELTPSGLLEPIAFGLMSGVSSGAILDLDDDTHNDVCFGTSTTGSVYGCLNLGTTFGAPELLFNSSQSWITDMLGGDFNGDGFEDLAIGTDGEGLLIIGWNNGTHLNPKVRAGVSSLPGDRWITSLAKGHFNNDSFLDLAIGATSDTDSPYNAVIIFQSNGTALANFTYAMVLRSSAFFNIGLVAADFDSDGLDELAYSHATKWQGLDSYISRPAVIIQSDVAALPAGTTVYEYSANEVVIEPFDPNYVTYPDLFPFGQEGTIDYAISALATPDINGDSQLDLVYITIDNGYLYAYYGADGQIYDPYTDFIHETTGILNNPTALKALLAWFSSFFVSLVLLWFYDAEKQEYLRGDKFWEVGTALLIYVVLYGLRFGLLMLPPEILLPLYSTGLISFLGSTIASYTLAWIFGLILIILLSLAGIDAVGDFVGSPAAWCTLIMGILLLVFWVVFAFSSVYAVFLSAIVSSVLCVISEIILGTLRAQEKINPILKIFLSLAIWFAVVSVFGGMIDAWLGA